VAPTKTSLKVDGLSTLIINDQAQIAAFRFDPDRAMMPSAAPIAEHAAFPLLIQPLHPFCCVAVPWF
jgi:hypothetical protein